MNHLIEISARIMLGHIFLLSGITKMGAAYAGTAAYMASMGVPGSLLPLVIIFEIVSGLLIIAGFKLKWAAIILAGFTLLTGIIFHSNFAEQMQVILFMKNISIAGGLLLLSIHQPGAWTVDQKLANSQQRAYADKLS